MVRAFLIATLVLAALAVESAPAGAHAIVRSTSPERGAAVGQAPGRVVLRFSEPIEIAFGAVRVFDAKGGQVQAGKPFHPGGESSAVAVRLSPDLPRGGYTATYRVVSADSHPVTGGFSFGIGSAAAPDGRVDELLAGESAGPAAPALLAAARTVQYGAISVGLGVLAVLLLAWLPALRACAGASPAWREADSAFGARLRRLMHGAALAGVFSALAALALQAATARGASPWATLDGIADVLDTRFGLVWGLGVITWLIVLGHATSPGLALPSLRSATVGATGSALTSPGGATALLAVPVLLLALLPGLGGHGSLQEPVAVMLPANVLHVLAAGAWIGGIAVLVLALPAAARRLEEADRTQLMAGVITRFSTVALAAVAALLAGGIVQSLIEIAEPDDLLDTAFGRAVLVKAALVAVLLGLGALNRRRTIPALRRAASAGESHGAAGVLLRRTLRTEVALGVAALAATGALAGYAPAAAQSGAAFSAKADLGPARAELTVDAARAGSTSARLDLFDRSDGRRYDAPREVRIEASLPERGIGPIRLDARRTGAGQYLIASTALSPPGDWRLEVVARISEFDELRATFTVPID